MIIDAHGLRKTYRSRRTRDPRRRSSAAAAGNAGKGADLAASVAAVKGIDLTVEKGEIFGVLGPNGAGKTTTIRMLATLITPDSGTATVAGHDLLTAPEKVRRSIGYVSQTGGVDDTTTPRASLRLAARINGLSAAEAAERSDEMLAAFDLTGCADRPARTLSGGQKRRVALALGLIHRPPLLFLDEPTTGLDPQNRANLWDHIRTLRDQGTSVLLSTHYLDEADSLCDRLVIIDHGQIVAEGSPAELKRAIAGDVVSLRLSSPPPGREPGGEPDARSVEQLLRTLPYAREIKADGELLQIYTDDGEHAMPHLLATLTEHGHTIQSIALHRATLDEVFLHKTGRRLRDAA